MITVKVEKCRDAYIPYDEVEFTGSFSVRPAISETFAAFLQELDLFALNPENLVQNDINRIDELFRRLCGWLAVGITDLD